MTGSLSRSDVNWLINELLQSDIQAKSGNKDRYVAGRRVALAQAASKFLHVTRFDLERYMKWVAEQVEQGSRVGALEEPLGWVRKNPA